MRFRGSRRCDPRSSPTTNGRWSGAAAPLNIFLTLVRYPGLFRKWLPFGGKLLAGGKLSPRDRELIILRTAFRCGARYEWAQHVAIAGVAGLASEEILRVAAGPDANGWNAEDATLLRAVDELHDDHCVGDATWKALAVATEPSSSSRSRCSRVTTRCSPAP